MGLVSRVSNMGMLQETALMVNLLKEPLVTKAIKEGEILERNSLARKQNECACYCPMTEIHVF